MRARRIGFAAWLLLAACLYFFENNTGTRVILICSLLFPLVPLLRGALFAADRAEAEPAPRPLTVRTFVRRESDEPGDIRPYRPGDPIRRIHWKLSAKRDELLVREAAPAEEAAEEERTPPPSGSGGRKGAAGRIALLPAAHERACIAPTNPPVDGLDGQFAPGRIRELHHVPSCDRIRSAVSTTGPLSDPA